MSVTDLWSWIPQDIVELLNFGAEYPDGDAEAMFALRDVWHSFADEVRALAPELEDAVGSALSYDVLFGDLAETARVQLRELTSGELSFENLASGMDDLADFLGKAAAQMEYEQIVMAIFAGLTAHAIIRVLLVAPQWAGLIIPMLLAAGRKAIAAGGIRLGEMLALMAAVPGPRNYLLVFLAEIIVPGLKAGGKMGLAGAGLDLAVQSYQIEVGHRQDIDTEQFFGTLMMWAAGGAVGVSAAKQVERWLSRSLSLMARSTVAGAVGGAGGAVGMWTAGIMYQAAVQLARTGTVDLDAIEWAFHKEMLVGGVVTGAMHGVASGMRAELAAAEPRRYAVGESTGVPDAADSRVPEYGTRKEADQLFRNLMRDTRLNEHAMSAERRTYNERFVKDASASYEDAMRSHREGDPIDLAALRNLREAWEAGTPPGAAETRAAGASASGSHTPPGSGHSAGPTGTTAWTTGVGPRAIAATPAEGIGARGPEPKAPPSAPGDAGGGTLGRSGLVSAERTPGTPLEAGPRDAPAGAESPIADPVPDPRVLAGARPEWAGELLDPSVSALDTAVDAVVADGADRVRFEIAERSRDRTDFDLRISPGERVTQLESLLKSLRTAGVSATRVGEIASALSEVIGHAAAGGTGVRVRGAVIPAETGQVGLFVNVFDSNGRVTADVFGGPEGGGFPLARDAAAGFRIYQEEWGGTRYQMWFDELPTLFTEMSFGAHPEGARSPIGPTAELLLRQSLAHLLRGVLPAADGPGSSAVWVLDGAPGGPARMADLFAARSLFEAAHRLVQGGSANPLLAEESSRVGIAGAGTVESRRSTRSEDGGPAPKFRSMIDSVEVRARSEEILQRFYREAHPDLFPAGPARTRAAEFLGEAARTVSGSTIDGRSVSGSERLARLEQLVEDWAAGVAEYTARVGAGIEPRPVAGAIGSDTSHAAVSGDMGRAADAVADLLTNADWPIVRVAEIRQAVAEAVGAAGPDALDSAQVRRLGDQVRIDLVDPTGRVRASDVFGEPGSRPSTRFTGVETTATGEQKLSLGFGVAPDPIGFRVAPGDSTGRARAVHEIGTRLAEHGLADDEISRIRAAIGSAVDAVLRSGGVARAELPPGDGIRVDIIDVEGRVGFLDLLHETTGWLPARAAATGFYFQPLPGGGTRISMRFDGDRTLWDEEARPTHRTTVAAHGGNSGGGKTARPSGSGAAVDPGDGGETRTAPRIPDVRSADTETPAAHRTDLAEYVLAGTEAAGSGIASSAEAALLGHGWSREQAAEVAGRIGTAVDTVAGRGSAASVAVSIFGDHGVLVELVAAQDLLSVVGRYPNDLRTELRDERDEFTTRTVDLLVRQPASDTGVIDRAIGADYDVALGSAYYPGSPGTADFRHRSTPVSGARPSPTDRSDADGAGRPVVSGRHEEDGTGRRPDGRTDIPRMNSVADSIQRYRDRVLRTMLPSITAYAAMPDGGDDGTADRPDAGGDDHRPPAGDGRTGALRPSLQSILRRLNAGDRESLVGVAEIVAGAGPAALVEAGAGDVGHDDLAAIARTMLHYESAGSGSGWRADRRLLFRGDTRDPGTVFAAGFAPNTVYGRFPASDTWVSTTDDIGLAAGYGRTGAVNEPAYRVYVADARGGFANRSGGLNLLVQFPAGIASRFVLGCVEIPAGVLDSPNDLEDRLRSGDESLLEALTWIPNPHHGAAGAAAEPSSVQRPPVPAVVSSTAPTKVGTPQLIEAETEVRTAAVASAVTNYALAMEAALLDDPAQALLQIRKMFDIAAEFASPPERTDRLRRAVREYLEVALATARPDREIRSSGSWAVVTEIGGRDVQQDAYAAAESVTGGGKPVTIGVVCDGIGSAPSSHIASQLAARVARDSLVASLRRGMAPYLAVERGIQDADQAVTTLVGLYPDVEPRIQPGTTIAVAICEPGEVGEPSWITGGAIGDSSVYAVTRDGARRVAGSGEEGGATPSLGNGDVPESSGDYLFEEELDSAAVVLLGSDGLSGDLVVDGTSDDPTELESAAAGIVERSAAHGGDDNKTALLISLRPRQSVGEGKIAGPGTVVESEDPVLMAALSDDPGPSIRIDAADPDIVVRALDTQLRRFGLHDEFADVVGLIVPAVEAGGRPRITSSWSPDPDHDGEGELVVEVVDALGNQLELNARTGAGSADLHVTVTGSADSGWLNAAHRSVAIMETRAGVGHDARAERGVRHFLDRTSGGDFRLLVSSGRGHEGYPLHVRIDHGSPGNPAPQRLGPGSREVRDDLGDSAFVYRLYGRDPQVGWGTTVGIFYSTDTTQVDPSMDLNEGLDTDYYRKHTGLAGTDPQAVWKSRTGQDISDPKTWAHRWTGRALREVTPDDRDNAGQARAEYENIIARRLRASGAEEPDTQDRVEAWRAVGWREKWRWTWAAPDEVAALPGVTTAWQDLAARYRALRAIAELEASIHIAHWALQFEAIAPAEGLVRQLEYEHRLIWLQSVLQAWVDASEWGARTGVPVYLTQLDPDLESARFQLGVRESAEEIDFYHLDVSLLGVSPGLAVAAAGHTERAAHRTRRRTSVVQIGSYDGVAGSAATTRANHAVAEVLATRLYYSTLVAESGAAAEDDELRAAAEAVGITDFRPDVHTAVFRLGSDEIRTPVDASGEPAVGNGGIRTPESDSYRSDAEKRWLEQVMFTPQRCALVTWGVISGFSEQTGDLGVHAPEPHRFDATLAGVVLADEVHAAWVNIARRTDFLRWMERVENRFAAVALDGHTVFLRNSGGTIHLLDPADVAGIEMDFLAGHPDPGSAYRELFDKYGRPLGTRLDGHAGVDALVFECDGRPLVRKDDDNDPTRAIPSLRILFGEEIPGLLAGIGMPQEPFENAGADGHVADFLETVPAAAAAADGERIAATASPVLREISAVLGGAIESADRWYTDVGDALSERGLSADQMNVPASGTGAAVFGIGDPGMADSVVVYSTDLSPPPRPGEFARNVAELIREGSDAGRDIAVIAVAELPEDRFDAVGRVVADQAARASGAYSGGTVDPGWCRNQVENLLSWLPAGHGPRVGDACRAAAKAVLETRAPGEVPRLRIHDLRDTRVLTIETDTARVTIDSRSGTVEFELSVDRSTEARIANETVRSLLGLRHGEWLRKLDLVGPEARRLVEWDHDLQDWKWGEPPGKNIGARAGRLHADDTAKWLGTWISAALRVNDTSEAGSTVSVTVDSAGAHVDFRENQADSAWHRLEVSQSGRWRGSWVVPPVSRAAAAGSETMEWTTVHRIAVTKQLVDAWGKKWPRGLVIEGPVPDWFLLSGRGHSGTIRATLGDGDRRHLELELDTQDSRLMVYGDRSASFDEPPNKRLLLTQVGRRREEAADQLERAGRAVETAEAARGDAERYLMGLVAEYNDARHSLLPAEAELDAARRRFREGAAGFEAAVSEGDLPEHMLAEIREILDKALGEAWSAADQGAAATPLGSFAEIESEAHRLRTAAAGLDGHESAALLPQLADMRADLFSCAQRVLNHRAARDDVELLFVQSGVPLTSVETFCRAMETGDPDRVESARRDLSDHRAVARLVGAQTWRMERERHRENLRMLEAFTEVLQSDYRAGGTLEPGAAVRSVADRADELGTGWVFDPDTPGGWYGWHLPAVRDATDPETMLDWLRLVTPVGTEVPLFLFTRHQLEVVKDYICRDQSDRAEQVADIMDDQHREHFQNGRFARIARSRRALLGYFRGVRKDELLLDEAVQDLRAAADIATVLAAGTDDIHGFVIDKKALLEPGFEKSAEFDDEARRNLVWRFRARLSEYLAERNAAVVSRLLHDRTELVATIIAPALADTAAAYNSAIRSLIRYDPTAGEAFEGEYAEAEAVAGRIGDAVRARYAEFAGHLGQKLEDAESELLEAWGAGGLTGAERAAAVTQILAAVQVETAVPVAAGDRDFFRPLLGGFFLWARHPRIETVGPYASFAAELFLASLKSLDEDTQARLCIRMWALLGADARDEFYGLENFPGSVAELDGAGRYRFIVLALQRSSSRAAEGAERSRREQAVAEILTVFDSEVTARLRYCAQEDLRRYGTYISAPAGGDITEADLTTYIANMPLAERAHAELGAQLFEVLNGRAHITLFCDPLHELAPDRARLGDALDSGGKLFLKKGKDANGYTWTRAGLEFFIRVQMEMESLGIPRSNLEIRDEGRVPGEPAVEFLTREALYNPDLESFYGCVDRGGQGETADAGRGHQFTLRSHGEYSQPGKCPHPGCGQKLSFCLRHPNGVVEYSGPERLSCEGFEISDAVGGGDLDASLGGRDDGRLWLHVNSDQFLLFDPDLRTQMLHPLGAHRAVGMHHYAATSHGDRAAAPSDRAYIAAMKYAQLREIHRTWVAMERDVRPSAEAAAGDTAHLTTLVLEFGHFAGHGGGRRKPGRGAGRQGRSGQGGRTGR